MAVAERLHFVVCPRCRGDLTWQPDSVRCAQGHAYERTDGIVYFAPMSEHRLHGGHGTHRENRGAATRIERFVLPRIRERFGDTDVRVLDDGCGAGGAVRAFVDQGVDAYGVDPGPRRKDWPALDLPDRLFGADGEHLPFETGAFDVVTSSGVLEHVGEHDPGAERERKQAAYVEELLRVLRPGGIALVAYPNGMCPIDFWHGGQIRGLRLHAVPDPDLLPTASDLERWVTKPGGDVEFLSPEGYLAFKKVSRRWWGRLLAPLVQVIFSAFSRFPALARMPLNPFLVGEVTQRPAAQVVAGNGRGGGIRTPGPLPPKQVR